jgi:hypothetical protein
MRLRRDAPKHRAGLGLQGSSDARESESTLIRKGGYPEMRVYGKERALCRSLLGFHIGSTPLNEVGYADSGQVRDVAFPAPLLIEKGRSAASNTRPDIRAISTKDRPRLSVNTIIRLCGSQLEESNDPF